MIDNLPPELLFDILSDIVAGYIDRAITAPPANERREVSRSFDSIKPVDVPSQKEDVKSMLEDALAVIRIVGEVEGELEGYGVDDDEYLRIWEMQENEERLAENDIAPLLSVSTHLRAMTLVVLGTALRTEIDDNGR
jgi:hypothetical protein